MVRKIYITNLPTRSWYDQLLLDERSYDREGMSEAASTGWQCNHVIGSVPDEHLVHKQAQLVLYSLCDRQPVQLPQSRSDMVAEI